MCDLQLTEKGGMLFTIYLIPLIVTVSVAVVCDFRNWRIPNRLIAAGLIQGFAVSAITRGLSFGFVSSIAGCIIPVAVLFVLFLIRALGAGDIKLFAVAGSFVGTDVTKVLVYSFLAGGVISIVFLLKEFILHRLQMNSYVDGASEESITNRRIFSKKQLRGIGKNRVHFSAAILGGVLYYVLTIGGR